jgi:hypothetical protein
MLSTIQHKDKKHIETNRDKKGTTTIYTDTISNNESSTINIQYKERITQKLPPTRSDC